MKISEIEKAGGPLRRHLPIQSIEQLISFLLFAGLGIAVVALLLLPLHEAGALPYMIIGGLVGGSAVLPMTMRYRFTVQLSETESPRAVHDRIAQLLESKGYRRIDSDNPAETIFSTRLPAFLKWRENTFRITQAASVISVTGPRFMLSYIRSKLVAG